jgi:purine-binding chemotaxis protein CheW
MGRLADARRRARAGKGGAPGTEVRAPAAPELPGGASEDRPATTRAAVPTAVPEPPRPRIVLPPSGLAEDILADPSLRHAVAEPAAAPTPATEAPLDRITFFALPSAEEQAPPPEPAEHLATFHVGREEYGVEVRRVQEIIRVPPITQVPRAPERLRGVVNLRGRVIPVFDLKRTLGLGEVELQRASRIVVVRLRDRLLGLLVDSASQVLRVPLSAIAPAPDEAGAADVAGVRGVARLKERLIILLDLEKALATELGMDARARERQA